MAYQQIAGGYKNITATTQVTTQAATILCILCASTTSGTYQVYDSATGTTTTPITGVVTPTPGSSVTLYATAGAGIYIVTTGTINLTVVFA